MYAYLKGTLEEINDGNIVVEVNGIGYNVQMASGRYETFPSLGDPIKVYTYTCVREDSFSLFGFFEKQDMDMFKLLISVNTIGPKIAQDILSAMTPQDLVFAISGGDVKRISKAPGVGTKKAERIVLELKDKVNVETAFQSLGVDNGLVANLSGANSNNAFVINEEINNAILALAQLGYGQIEAKKAVLETVKEIGEDKSSDDYIRGALKYLL